MSLHNTFPYNLRKPFPLVSLILSSCLLLSGCTTDHGYERILQTGITGETGEYYDSRSVTQMTFDEFCMTVFQDELSEADTLDLHYTLLNPEAYGIHPCEPSLGTYSLEDMIQNLADGKELKQQLSTFDRSTLTNGQQVTYDALMYTLDTSLMAEGLELYEQPLAPTIGIQAQLPILLTEYSFHSTKDIEDYLALLSQMDRYYAEILDFERQKADAGLGPSDATIDAIIQSCESYLIDPESNFLTETFEARIADMETELQSLQSSTSRQQNSLVSNQNTLTLQQKADYTTRHLAAIKDHFIPAYQSLIEGMTALKGRGLNDSGLANFKDGKTYYEYLLKYGPGLSYTVPELKAALNARMQSDYKAINGLFLQYPDLSDKVMTSTFTLTDPVQILEDLKRQMVNDFPALPDCDYEINYVPSHLEDSLSPAFYLTAPLDNINHNVIYINNGYPDSTSGLYTTLAHEGFPGHLYQTVYNRANAPTPLRSILSCSGANEGWATYVENYACTLDNGLPEGVGEYRALIRSFSLCVHGMLDVGINYDGWDKETAAKFISSCFQVDDETIDELWQTMIDNPTNYLEYCGGYLEIMEMREQAETTLGENFSALEFHRFLLDIGPVPFPVIRTHFNIWLEEQTTLIRS